MYILQVGLSFSGTNLVNLVHAFGTSFSPSICFSNITSSDANVVLVTSMYFNGIGNVSSLGTYSLTLGTTWWRKMNFPVIVQKSFLASSSSRVESSWSWVGECNSSAFPRRISFLLLVPEEPGSRRMFSDAVSPQRVLTLHLRLGIWSFHFFAALTLPLTLSLRAWSSDASISSNSSVSATIMSPFQIPPAYNAQPLSISKLTNGIGSTCDLAIQGRLETSSRQEVLRDFLKCMLGVLSEIRNLALPQAPVHLGVTTSASLQRFETGRPVRLPQAHSLNSWDGKGLCKYNNRMLGTLAKWEGLYTPLQARAWKLSRRKACVFTTSACLISTFERRSCAPFRHLWQTRLAGRSDALQHWQTEACIDGGTLSQTVLAVHVLHHFKQELSHIWWLCTATVVWAWEESCNLETNRPSKTLSDGRSLVSNNAYSQRNQNPECRRSSIQYWTIPIILEFQRIQ